MTLQDEWASAQVRQDDHARLSTKFERWAIVCLQAGEIKWAEQYRADAQIHARLAEPYHERKIA